MNTSLEDEIKQLIGDPKPALVRGIMGRYSEKYSILSVMNEIWLNIDVNKSLELDLFGHKTFRYYLRLKGDPRSYPKVYLNNQMIDFWIDHYCKIGYSMTNYFNDNFTDLHIKKFIKNDALYIIEIPKNRMTTDFLDTFLGMMTDRIRNTYKVLEIIELKAEHFDYLYSHKLMQSVDIKMILKNPNSNRLNSAIRVLEA